MNYLVRKRNKFSNKTTTYNGRWYQSKHEASVAQDLDLARHAVDERERVVNITPQFSITFYGTKDGFITDEHVPGCIKIGQYRPDFLVEYADGHKKIIEAKGAFLMKDRAFRQLWTLTEILYGYKYPDVELEIIQNQAWKKRFG